MLIIAKLLLLERWSWRLYYEFIYCTSYFNKK